MRILTLFCIAILFSGCAKAPPKELPPLVSCKVRVHDKQRPIAKVGVAFQRQEGQPGWSLNGVTGTDGLATAGTIFGSYEAPGIPIGSYRITLSERIELPPELNDDNESGIAMKRQKYVDEHRTLPEILCDSSKTPLELSVTGPGAELDVDVSHFK